MPLLPGRKVFHACGLVIPLVLLTAGKVTALALTACLLALVGGLDILRIKGYFKWEFLQKQLKKEESARPTGSLFFLVSALATILLFERSVAAASLFVLCLSDPLASVIGVRWGKRRLLPGKSMEGTAAFFLSSLIILAAFSFRAQAVIGAACAATLTELFSLRFVDDNLSIPLITAVSLTVLTR
jgi:dolichol kinase